MESKDGVLGVLVVALALVGAMFGSYLAGVEPIENEVTAYKWLADIGTLFEYDESPQYIEFDPSSNYTGYYSTESFSEFGDKFYFAEDEVGYKAYSKVNNYRVDLLLDNEEEGTKSLTTVNGNYPNNISNSLNYWNLNSTATHGYGFTKQNLHFTGVTIDVLLEALFGDNNPNTPLSFDTAYLRSTIDIGYDGGTYQNLFADVNWVIFGLKSDFDNGLLISQANYCSENWKKNADMSGFQNYNPDDWKVPSMAIQVDVKNQTVSMYYDTLYKNPSYTNVNLSDCIIIFGGGNSTASTDIVFGDMIDYMIGNKRVDYLDPNYGVYMKE